MNTRQDEHVGAADLLAGQVPMAQIVPDLHASATPLERVDMVPVLFGKVYQSAPPAEKGFLIKQLIRPLGMLSLAAIANGVFATIRFQGSFNNLQPKLEDIQAVREEDVVALVSYVQQVSAQAVNGLGHVLASSPTLASSAVAVVLAKILLDRAKSSRNDDSRVKSIPHFPERRSRSK